jgi:hypothetical protein
MSTEITAPVTIATVSITAPVTTAPISVVAPVTLGAVGPAGPNSVTSATTSDGTATLSLSSVTAATAEVTGTLTANHIHGNLAGNVYAHVRAGEALAKGDPVYVSGFHPGTSTAIVSKADADDAAKMPAVGVMDAAVAHNINGHMVITGVITDVDTGSYAVNTELYVKSGGGLTATPPAARAQPVARVERSNNINGAVLVKVNGLSASDPTPSTLVRRDASGGARFGDLETNTITASGIVTTGQVEFNGTDAGDSMGFNMVNYSYGTGAAEAHRAALGSGGVGDALFLSQTPEAARTTLGVISRVMTANVYATSTTPVAIPALTFPVVANKTYRIEFGFAMQSWAASGYQVTMNHPNLNRVGNGYSFLLHGANFKLVTLNATSTSLNRDTAGNPNGTMGMTGYAYIRPTASGNVTFTTSHQTAGSTLSIGPLAGSGILVTEL